MSKKKISELFRNRVALFTEYVSNDFEKATQIKMYVQRAFCPNFVKSNSIKKLLKQNFKVKMKKVFCQIRLSRWKFENFIQFLFSPQFLFLLLCHPFVMKAPMFPQPIQSLELL